MLYELFIRPMLFYLSKNDPEIAHEKAMKFLETLPERRFLFLKIQNFTQVDSARLEQEILGMYFPNPVGLAAGFDKNAIALQGLEALGFGFIETGTVTSQEQAGNPRPRIFRLTKDAALINRMGFNNHGAEAIAKRIGRTSRLNIPLGISIGKSKVIPLEKACEDYILTLRKVIPFADYIAINVSSPNTPGLRELQDKKYLDDLLRELTREVREYSEQKKRKPVPLFIKVSPDLTWSALDELLRVCSDRGIQGIIATNTTLSREGISSHKQEVGGLSGRPLFEKSLAFVKHIRLWWEDVVIIGSGGITHSGDAYAMLQAGANLVQIFTGLIYNGPFFIRKLNKEIVQYMKRDGIQNISEMQKN